MSLSNYLALLCQSADLASDAVVLLSAGETPFVLHANAATERLVGRPLSSVHGMPWPGSISDDPDARLIGRSLLEGAEYTGTVQLSHRDGRRIRVIIQARPLRKADAQVFAWHCLIVPAAESEMTLPHLAAVSPQQHSFSRTRDRFSRIDKVDGSSGMLRYERFEAITRRDFEVARSQHKPVSLALVDLLELDVYRETFGAHAAHSCLRMIGKCICSTMRRDTDLIAQYEDNAIIIALPGHTVASGGMLTSHLEASVDRMRIRNPRGTKSSHLAVRVSLLDDQDSGAGYDALLSRLIMVTRDLPFAQSA